LSAAPVISVIDDDASVRAATGNLVRSLGYTVHVFASAEAFLQSQRLNETACVVTDIRMPVMSGLELQVHLRAQGSRVPFIFITALPDDSVRVRAFEGGASGFLTKPFDESALIGCLDAALARLRETDK
jgi:FixJ family two-component response regulator